MVGAGISDGDELVVDRSITPVDGNVVVAIVDGELTIKRLRLQHGRVRLVAENPEYLNVLVELFAELPLSLGKSVVHPRFKLQILVVLQRVVFFNEDPEEPVLSVRVVLWPVVVVFQATLVLLAARCAGSRQGGGPGRKSSDGTAAAAFLQLLVETFRDPGRQRRAGGR